MFFLTCVFFRFFQKKRFFSISGAPLYPREWPQMGASCLDTRAALPPSIYPRRQNCKIRPSQFFVFFQLCARAWARLVERQKSSPESMVNRIRGPRDRVTFWQLCIREKSAKKISRWLMGAKWLFMTPRRRSPGTLWGSSGNALGPLWARFGELLGSSGELLGCGGDVSGKIKAVGARHPAVFSNST